MMLLLSHPFKLSSTSSAQKTSSSKHSVRLSINLCSECVIGLNGVPPVDDDDISSSLGGIYYGASIECTITDIDGTPSLSKGIISIKIV